MARFAPDEDIDAWCDDCFADMVTVLDYLLDRGEKGATEEQLVRVLKKQSVRKEYWGDL